MRGMLTSGCGLGSGARSAVSVQAERALKPSSPLLDYSLKLREAIGQSRGAGLQDQRRFDLIDVSALHAGICANPGRAATRSGRNFFPHHEPMIRSGLRATTSSTVTTRSLAAL
jgi:hypothetical protein